MGQKQSHSSTDFWGKKEKEKERKRKSGREKERKREREKEREEQQQEVENIGGGVTFGENISLNFNRSI